MFQEDSFLRRLKKSKRNKQHEILTPYDLLETVFYESKPLIYLFISIWALRSPYGDATLVKFSSLGVLIFAAAIIHARLLNRGFIK